VEIEEGFSKTAIKSLKEILIFPLTGRIGPIILSLYTIGGYSMEREKGDVLLRLRRIEGQLRGLQRMVEGGVPCVDILTQVAAVTAAIKKVGVTVVKTYMEECLDKTRREPGVKREEALKDFQKAVSRYIDWA
jgi:CsoR family transcriptional regulator, copper-sensing transcriptional repressor